MATNLTGDFLPPNRELCTYFQNNLRTDILKIENPLGYGVPMSPKSVVAFVPRFSPSGDLAYLNNSLEDQFISFNRESPFYVAQKASFNVNGISYSVNGYMQFDWLRCINILPSNNVSVATAPIVTLIGFDDRGVLVSEKLTGAVQGAGEDVPLISNKAYYGLLGIITQAFGDNVLSPVDLDITCDNSYFGYQYYTYILGTVTTFTSSTQGIPAEQDTVLVQGLNFRAVVPNNKPTSYANSTNPTLATQSNIQGDARGLFKLNTPLVMNNSLIINIENYSMGSDSDVNAIISRPSLNGSIRKQRAFQYAVSRIPFLPINPLAPTLIEQLAIPTKLTEFDTYGAQYPGDKVLFNKTFETIPTWRMA